MKRIFLSFFCLFFVFVSCKKNNQTQTAPSNPPRFTFTCPTLPEPVTNVELLACKFLAGTFWVFKDSVTNTIDTLLVQELTKSASYDLTNPCLLETFWLKMIFKNDTSRVLKQLNYTIRKTELTLQNNFFWTVGAQPAPFAFHTSKNEKGYILWDSLFMNDRYYDRVGESYAIQFTTVEYFNSPVKMYSQSLKSYFNSEFGFLQFDLRDRLTGQLTGRRKVIERNIIR